MIGFNAEDDMRDSVVLRKLSTYRKKRDFEKTAEPSRRDRGRAVEAAGAS